MRVPQLPNDSAIARAINQLSESVYDLGIDTRTGRRETFQSLAHGGGEIHERGTVSTSNATVTNIVTLDVAANEAWQVEAVGVGRKTAGTDYFLGHIQALFYREGGNVTQVGATAAVIAAITTGGAAAWALTADADTVNQRIRIRVTGAAATAIDWKAFVRAFRVIA